MSRSQSDPIDEAWGIRRWLIYPLGISLLVSLCLLLMALYFLRASDQRFRAHSDASLIEAEFSGIEQQLSGFMVMLDLLVGAEQTYLSEDVCRSASAISVQIKLLGNETRWGGLRDDLFSLLGPLSTIEKAVEGAGEATGESSQAVMPTSLYREVNSASTDLMRGVERLAQSVVAATESSEADVRRDQQLVDWITVGTPVVIFLIHLATGLWISRQIGDPIRGLHEAAERALEHGQFESEPAGPLEVRRLNRRFNELITGLEEQVQSKSQQVLTHEKLAVIGQMSASLAHEINGHLMVLSLNSEQLQEEMDGSSFNPRNINALIDENMEVIQSITSVVSGLRTLARDSSGDPLQPADVSPLVAGCLALARSKAKRRGVALVGPGSSEGLVIEARPGQISQVLLNLVGNAIDAAAFDPTSREGMVRIKLVRRSRSVDFLVLDNGPGVPVGMEEKVFEAFVTTKTVGEGTGLGLSVAKRLTEANGGELIYERKEGWTCFRLTIPSHKV
jgi:signal transduction histidine kinase